MKAKDARTSRAEANNWQNGKCGSVIAQVNKAIGMKVSS
jgi:hypothetical protein